eukprot:GFUD01100762.1.p1 GENE.GFUD01100762.1~~GFUD01100762.1.p1  ORF type:complete len:572 (+),score=152.27 GFUD01100762.1:60-1775(+)
MKAFKSLHSLYHRGAGKLNQYKSVPKSLSNISLSRGFTSVENIVSSDLADVTIPTGQITPFIAQKTAQYSGTVAMEDAITGESLTYDELLDKVQCFTKGLINLGFSPGDVISVALPNCIEYPAIVLGGAAAQCVVSPVNSAYTGSELRGLIEASSAKMVVTNLDNYQKIRLATESMEDVRIMLIDSAAVGRKGRQDVLTLTEVCNIASRSSLPEFSGGDGDSVLLLPFSSGTTGKPKGVMLTHRNYIANIVQMEPLKLDMEGKKSVLIMPMFHAGGMKSLMESLYQGGKTITLPSFTPDTYLDALLKHQPEQLTMAPPLVQFVSKSEKATPKHLESLEKVYVGAAPVGESLIHDFLKKAPQAQFREVWGMTELSAVGTFTTEKIVPGSCGKIMPNSQLRVVDLETGRNLGPGSENKGEICIRGPQVMKGYLNNEIETEHTLREGWIHTGDIGYFDEDENIYISDRLKELIKVKGYQVAPAELEDVIRSIAEVTDVAVIGVDCPRNGEVPRAYVVSSSTALEGKQIKSFVASKLSPYKQLEGGVVFVKEIPKSAAGKILRKDLKAEYMKQGV